jgi:hypothetical protein
MGQSLRGHPRNFPQRETMMNTEPLKKQLLDNSSLTSTGAVGEILNGLVLIWEIYDPDKMAGRLEYL